MTLWRAALVLGVAIFAFGCSRPSPEPAPSPATATATATATRYLLERVDDAAIAQLYAAGFPSLSLKDKVLVWHLSQAAIAGRDIYYDQRSRHTLAMREVLEAILTHPTGVDPAALREVERYTKLFWLNTGPYNNLTERKFLLALKPEALASAARTAAASGAEFPTASGETLDQLLARLAPMFFDSAFAPSITTKTPPPGQDILTASANNLYANVSLEDLAGFAERYGLNSRLVKGPRGLVEEVYRIGGRYDAPLREVVRHLEAARPFATAPMAKAIDALAKWYRTGEASDRRAYDIAWVEDQSSNIDTINGFTETYLDPRGVKGSWEALVYHVNAEKTGGIRRIAEHAQWFEDRMPWDSKFRKAGVRGITANAIDVVIEIGDAGPVTPVGINLPNDQTVREQHGSKSISLSNVSEAYDKSADSGFRGEFTWTPDEADRSKKWGSLAGELTTNMHEVIGHASGKVDARLQGRPETQLKEYFAALEEGRADLVGLYFIADPKMVELGLISAADHSDVIRTAYEGYTRNALVQLRRVRTGTQLEEDHMRNRQMIVHWLMRNTNAIEKRQRDGKTYYVMIDPGQFRAGVGRLLAEVQRIKGEGDFAAGKALFDTYGIHFDAALRDEVVRRVDALKLASYTGFVMPRLEAIRAADGAINDVRISYPQDFKSQMLEYSAATRDTRRAMMRAD